MTPQHLFCFQQEGAGATGRVIYLVNFRFPNRSQTGQQFRNISRSKELTARFSGVAGVHGHQILIGIAKSINVVVFYVAKIHRRHAV